MNKRTGGRISAAELENLMTRQAASQQFHPIPYDQVGYCNEKIKRTSLGIDRVANTEEVQLGVGYEEEETAATGADERGRSAEELRRVPELPAD